VYVNEVRQSAGFCNTAQFVLQNIDVMYFRMALHAVRMLAFFRLKSTDAASYGHSQTNPKHFNGTIICENQSAAKFRELIPGKCTPFIFVRENSAKLYAVSRRFAEHIIHCSSHSVHDFQLFDFNVLSFPSNMGATTNTFRRATVSGVLLVIGKF
jgi:hypothetical protein